jgi:diguanylate cyclase (GGDEF)-like protein
MEGFVAASPGLSATVFYLDIGGFKAVNDRGGHALGDIALQAVSRAVRAAVRGSDVCARIGGDEFIVLMPDLSDSESIARICKRITDAVAALVPLGDGDETRIGMSIGVGQLSGGKSLDAALSAADAELYKRKQLGSQAKRTGALSRQRRASVAVVQAREKQKPRSLAETGLLPFEPTGGSARREKTRPRTLFGQVSVNL